MRIAICLVTLALVIPAADSSPGVIPIADAAIIEVVLSHVPASGRVTITIPGRTLYAGPFGDLEPLEVARDKFPDEPTSLYVRAYDPEMTKRTLYSATASIHAPAREGEATGAVTRIVFGLDGVAWWTGPKETAPDPWDQIGRPTTAFADAPADPAVTVACVLDGDDPPPAITAGMKDLRVTVTVTNNADRPIRVLAIDLSSDHYLVFPTSARPAVVAPGESAGQSFRLDTFSDTRTGSLPIAPRVAFVYEGDDLLADGDFETATVTAEDQAGWQAAETATLSPLASSDEATAAFAARVADWQTYDQITFSNPAGVGVAGEAYAALKLSEKPEATLAALTQVCELPATGAYLLGCASWGGEEGCLELLDAEGSPIAGVKRNFTGHWWRDSVYNWTERVLRALPTEGATSARVSLFARSTSTRWDACYLAPAEAVRAATVSDLTLDVQPASAEHGVVYLGEDRDTQGDWIGNYGSYCWVLCAMSAPRDMVGGMVAPIKCKDASLTKAYRNETIWVRGEGEFRYASWTLNPKDAKTRHWIGAMRTRDRRALENPQWGERTHASWDDHGGQHPTDGWGPDMPVKLRVPEGMWKLSLYFLDWDWHDSALPRDHRLEISAGDEPVTCTARVRDLGEGVYKVFRVSGGRDLTLRIRKDRSSSVVLSGIFLDPLTEPEPAGGETNLADALADQRRAFDGYVQSLVDTLGAGPAAARLQEEADQHFEANDLGPAERHYDAALRLLAAGQTPTERANAHKQTGGKFRIMHPLYAQRHIRECLAALEELPEEEQAAYARALADELFATATEDYEQGRHLIRLPYVLAEFAYRRLTDLVGYDSLTPDERMGLMVCCRRQTWYAMGWKVLAAEQERLITTIPDEELTGALLTGLMSTYAVLAQTDARYIGKAAETAERLRTKRPDGDWTLDAHFRMAQIYYRGRRWDEAKEACAKVIELAPDGPEAGSAKRMIEAMKKDE